MNNNNNNNDNNINNKVMKEKNVSSSKVTQMLSQFFKKFQVS